MAFLKVKIPNIKKTLPIVLGVILVIGIGYYLGKTGKISPQIFKELPAQLSKPTPQETLPQEKLKLEEIPLKEKEIPAGPRKEAGKYIEKAQKGEGLTHLARRALKKYLAEHPQNFELKGEHKIYIEDYLAKSLGGGWLKLGQEVSFSEQLIQEALTKAQSLTDAQIQNLSQFVQLVPSL